MAAIARRSERRILVTGGAGFVGSNLVARLMEDPAAQITILDSLVRLGAEHNLAWLGTLPGRSRVDFRRGDVRREREVYDAAAEVDEIYHLAAQVAVTTSVADPRSDFDINALGTLNVLEAARRHGRQPFVLFTSTNKVYGGLHSVAVREHGSAYRAEDPAFEGANEETPLDFHSPYGCSKGCADQYVRDYARIYRLPAVVFRMSCIAGPRQFGNEDQGWVAHFLYSVLAGRPITIYGNGRQVRDILHVDDLVDAMVAARACLHATAGEIYNIGGGIRQAASVLQMLGEIEQLTAVAPHLNYAAVRPGDQPLYISDTFKFRAGTGWQPRRALPAILVDLLAFWQQHREVIESVQRRVASRAQAMVEDEVA